MDVHNANTDYLTLAGPTENQQPGPATGGYVVWTPIILVNPGSSATDTILAAWKLPFNFYVENVLLHSDPVGATTSVFELSSNSTPVIDGNEVAVFNTGWNLIDTTVGQIWENMYPTVYITHTGAKISQDQWLIAHITTGAAPADLNDMHLQVWGFPYGHVYDDPANDR